MTALPIRQPVRIIGIDPGLRRTGWGVIEADGNRLIYRRLRFGGTAGRFAAGEPAARDP